MFRAISRAEQAHATGHFKAMAGVPGAFSVTSAAGFGQQRTADNLAGAIEGETFEINEMYPAYMAVAESQGEPAAVRSMGFAIAAEQIHAAMYSRAKEAVEAGKDVELGTVQICTVCGHTLEGNVPDRCPICNAVREKYVTFA
jgi:rubrerythrin